MVIRPDWTGGSFGGVPVKPHPEATAAAARATAIPADRLFIEHLRLILGLPRTRPHATYGRGPVVETARRYDGHGWRAVTRCWRGAQNGPCSVSRHCEGPSLLELSRLHSLQRL